MTRKEAIEIINRENDSNDKKVWELFPKCREALDMAIQALSQEPKVLNTIDFAIDASNGDTNYFVGFRNGLRYAKSLIDGEEPQFESCAEQESCDDVVSRDAVIERLKKEDKILYTTTGLNYLIRVIEQLPPVTPKSSEDMPCITPEEMQKCKDIVKKYTPKQKPCTDAVSREAVIEWLENATYEDIIDAVGTELSFLPPVTQKYEVERLKKDVKAGAEIYRFTLNRIQNEIEQVEINGYIRDVECFRAGLNTAVKIIDKYKGDKE
jgi:hypothetical protein